MCQSGLKILNGPSYVGEESIAKPEPRIEQLSRRVHIPKDRKKVAGWIRVC
jgi:hypothetical protein